MIIVYILLAAIGGVFLVTLTYLVYLASSYYRIPDDLALTISHNQENMIAKEKKYKIMTYNVGFGAYEQDYSFFMDRGIMKNGKMMRGKYSRALSFDNCMTNITGSLKLTKNYDLDFLFLQELDQKATRSYKINQKNLFENEYKNYGSIYALNFHTKYLFYPLNCPHGKVESGILSLSKWKVNRSLRKSLPISTNLVSKFFDLDRCFLISYLPIEKSDKELVLINLHLSAYDKGGVYRNLQKQLLLSLLETEYAKGNYVIAGGDFNQEITDGKAVFRSEQQIPPWLCYFKTEELPEHFSFARSSAIVPTCRGVDLPYKKDFNYTVVIDGFLVSDNIEVISTTNINNEFQYSDHNPVLCEFKLK